MGKSLEEEIIYLRQLNESLSKKVSELEKRNELLLEALRRYELPPKVIGSIVRVVENEVIVRVGSNLYSVDAGNFKEEDLKVGRFVELRQDTLQIVRLLNEWDKGKVGRIVEKVEDYLLLKTKEDELIPLSAKENSKIKVGDEVIYLEPFYQVTQVFQRTEVERFFLPEKPKVSYSDVGGLKEQIERIREVIELPLKFPEEYKSLGLEVKGGILLYGPPGCGKTLLAKAVAGENAMNFLAISGPEILSKWVGESERILRAIFETARRFSPTIIFFDEFEALFRSRGFADTSGVHLNLVSQLLSLTDGIKSNEGVFIIAATNRLDVIDPALFRPGRFDNLIEVPRPNKEACREIMEIHFKNLPLDEEEIKNYGSYEEAKRNIINNLIKKIYDQESFVVKNGIKLVRYKDVISGDIVREIFKRAKVNYLKKRKVGIKEEEIMFLLDKVMYEYGTSLYPSDRFGEIGGMFG
ncbi:Proteasome-associated ATPase [archaeon HR06]|nr:Proteasome-associated ATPase [archaeon HR06]